VPAQPFPTLRNGAARTVAARTVAARTVAARTVAARTVAARTVAAFAATTVVLSLTACSASRTGHVAVAMDPAGRLLAVVALCKNQRLGSLTLTDETTGTSTTVRPKQSPPFGGTVILTGPIGDPRPEGVLDLLDRGHDYTLGGTTRGIESDEETGSFTPVRFKLDDAVREAKLRQAFVLAQNPDGDSTALTEKSAFVAHAAQECG